MCHCSVLIPALILNTGTILVILFAVIEREIEDYNNFSSSARLPWSRTRDEDFGANDLLRKCSQEKQIRKCWKQGRGGEKAE